jgi:hypothetical protein
MFLRVTTILIALLLVVIRRLVGEDGDDGGNHAKVYKHVVVFSIDGLHGSDVGKYIALRPKSTIAKLLETGFEYKDAFTSRV